MSLVPREAVPYLLSSPVGVWSCGEPCILSSASVVWAFWTLGFDRTSTRIVPTLTLVTVKIDGPKTKIV
jgi:hypothetical protein